MTEYSAPYTVVGKVSSGGDERRISKIKFWLAYRTPVTVCLVDSEDRIGRRSGPLAASSLRLIRVEILSHDLLMTQD